MVAKPLSIEILSLASPKAAAGWLEKCQALERKCFAKHEAMQVEAEACARGGTLVVAAADGGEVAGYAVLRRSSLALAVVKLVVAPHHRRRGIGRQLLARALDLGRDGRAQCATLHVDEANTPARRLYAAAGFVEGGRREDYYAVGRHAIFMERALDS